MSTPLSTCVNVPFGTTVQGKRNAVFVAITDNVQAYKDYDSESLSQEMKERFYPVVLMVARWDGRLGFPGGFVDGDESFEEAAWRELREEVNYPPPFSPKPQLTPLSSHEGEKVVVHTYHLQHAGEHINDCLRSTLQAAALAKHAISEGNAVWIHLADYGRGKGRDNLLGNNTLAFAVKEDLELLLTM